VKLASLGIHLLPGKKITFQKAGPLIYALCEGIKIGLASQIDEVIEPEAFRETFCGIITKVCEKKQMILVKVLLKNKGETV